MDSIKNRLTVHTTKPSSILTVMSILLLCILQYANAISKVFPRLGKTPVEYLIGEDDSIDTLNIPWSDLFTSDNLDNRIDMSIQSKDPANSKAKIGYGLKSYESHELPIDFEDAEMVRSFSLSNARALFLLSNGKAVIFSTSGSLYTKMTDRKVQCMDTVSSTITYLSYIVCTDIDSNEVLIYTVDLEGRTQEYVSSGMVDQIPDGYTIRATLHKYISQGKPTESILMYLWSPSGSTPSSSTYLYFCEGISSPDFDFSTCNLNTNKFLLINPADKTTSVKMTTIKAVGPTQTSHITLAGNIQGVDTLCLRLCTLTYSPTPSISCLPTHHKSSLKSGYIATFSDNSILEVDKDFNRVTLGWLNGNTSTTTWTGEIKFSGEILLKEMAGEVARVTLCHRYALIEGGSLKKVTTAMGSREIVGTTGYAISVMNSYKQESLVPIHNLGESDLYRSWTFNRDYVLIGSDIFILTSDSQTSVVSWQRSSLKEPIISIEMSELRKSNTLNMKIRSCHDIKAEDHLASCATTTVIVKRAQKNSAGDMVGISGSISGRHLESMFSSMYRMPFLPTDFFGNGIKYNFTFSENIAPSIDPMIMVSEAADVAFRFAKGEEVDKLANLTFGQGWAFGIDSTNQKAISFGCNYPQDAYVVCREETRLDLIRARPPKVATWTLALESSIDIGLGLHLKYFTPRNADPSEGDGLIVLFLYGKDILSLNVDYFSSPGPIQVFFGTDQYGYVTMYLAVVYNTNRRSAVDVYRLPQPPFKSYGPTEEIEFVETVPLPFNQSCTGSSAVRVWRGDYSLYIYQSCSEYTHVVRVERSQIMVERVLLPIKNATEIYASSNGKLALVTEIAKPVKETKLSILELSSLSTFEVDLKVLNGTFEKITSRSGMDSLTIVVKQKDNNYTVGVLSLDTPRKASTHWISVETDLTAPVVSTFQLNKDRILHIITAQDGYPLFNMTFTRHTLIYGDTVRFPGDQSMPTIPGTLNITLTDLYSNTVTVSSPFTMGYQSTDLHPVVKRRVNVTANRIDVDALVELDAVTLRSYFEDAEGGSGIEWTKRVEMEGVVGGNSGSGEYGTTYVRHLGVVNDLVYAFAPTSGVHIGSAANVTVWDLSKSSAPYLNYSRWVLNHGQYSDLAVAASDEWRGVRLFWLMLGHADYQGKQDITLLNTYENITGTRQSMGTLDADTISEFSKIKMFRVKEDKIAVVITSTSSSSSQSTLYLLSTHSIIGLSLEKIAALPSLLALDILAPPPASKDNGVFGIVGWSKDTNRIEVREVNMTSLQIAERVVFLEKNIPVQDIKCRERNGTHLCILNTYSEYLVEIQLKDGQLQGKESYYQKPPFLEAMDAVLTDNYVVATCRSTRPGVKKYLLVYWRRGRMHSGRAVHEEELPGDQSTADPDFRLPLALIPSKGALNRVVVATLDPRQPLRIYKDSLLTITLPSTNLGREVYSRTGIVFQAISGLQPRVTLEQIFDLPPLPPQPKPDGKKDRGSSLWVVLLVVVLVLVIIAIVAVGWYWWVYKREREVKDRLDEGNYGADNTVNIGSSTFNEGTKL